MKLIKDWPKNPIKALRYCHAGHLAIKNRVYLQRITQKELAEVLQCSQSNISKIEAGLLAPDFFVLGRILYIYGIGKVEEIIRFFCDLEIAKNKGVRNVEKI